MPVCSLDCTLRLDASDKPPPAALDAAGGRRQVHIVFCMVFHSDVGGCSRLKERDTFKHYIMCHRNTVRLRDAHLGMDGSEVLAAHDGVEVSLGVMRILYLESRSRVLDRH